MKNPKKNDIKELFTFYFADSKGNILDVSAYGGSGEIILNNSTLFDERTISVSKTPGIQHQTFNSPITFEEAFDIIR